MSVEVVAVAVAVEVEVGVEAGLGPVGAARREAAGREAALEEVDAVVERAAAEGRAAAARLEVPVAAAVQLLVGRHAEAHHLRTGPLYYTIYTYTYTYTSAHVM